jgi:hypothetical protein
MNTAAPARRRNTRFGMAASAVAVATALTAGFGATAATAAPSTQAAPTAVVQTTAIAPIESLAVTGTSVLGSFTGQLTNVTATTVGGVVTLTGSITGTATDAAGIVTPISDTFTTTLQGLSANGACSILTLDLGPLNLDLLGLVVDLSAIDLDITAQRGPGNLLGNLLCAVTGIFDRGGPLQVVSNLLNRLLG